MLQFPLDLLILCLPLNVVGCWSRGIVILIHLSVGLLVALITLSDGLANLSPIVGPSSNVHLALTLNGKARKFTIDSRTSLALVLLHVLNLGRRRLRYFLLTNTIPVSQQRLSLVLDITV